MSAGARGTAFAAILVVVFATAALAGAKISPSVGKAPAHDEGASMNMATHQNEDDDHASHGEGATDAALPGLASAEAGFRLIPGRDRFRAGEPATLSFKIVDSEGVVVRDFDVEHARLMHLIVVRRDFAGFQHLHPRQRANGTWEAEADFRRAGVYRAFADFSTGGRSLTLAGDVFVAGRFEPRPLPAPSRSAAAGDGYEVEIDSAAPAAGQATPVQFLVRKDGELLEGVEPYLDADGHLVALREHDQAFLHTHPEGEPGGAGPISFQVLYPTPGNYRLFLQFKDGGEVHTAAFTQAVDAGAAHSEGS